jgi:CSLREA domain-containing protein
MFQRTVKLFILAIAFAVVSIILANPAYAGTITVTIGFDRFDASASSDCSLREAIQTANTNTPFGSCQVAGALGDDVIVFDPGLTTVTISRTVSGDNNDNDDGDLDAYVGSVSGTLTIQGPITVEVTALQDRAFDVHADSSASGAFTLTQVVVRGGRLTFSTIEDASSGQDQLTCRYGGGGLRVRGGVTALLEGARVEDNIAVFSGGGICAREGATLVLTDTTVVSNAVGLNGNAIASFTAGGGGLWSMGATWLTNTFVITNRAVLSGGFFGLAGGGGVGVLTGTLTVVSATVRGNVAEQNSANEANGGGLMVARWSGGPSLVRIENSYIEDNQSLNGGVSYGGGAAFIQGVSVEMRNSIVARNVLSAAEGALGGGGAFGLSYQPSGYQPPTIDLDAVTFRNNTATVSITSATGLITPTVFGGGAFFGVNTVFTVTASTVQSNAIRYTGTSITNTNGFGGGLGTLNHTNGLISDTEILSNTAENFRFIGGAGMQTQGNQSRVINSRASGNYGVPSPANDSGGVFGGGYYVADWGAAHITGSRFEHNVITRTSSNSFTSGGGVGVDGKAFITHTVVQSNTATQGGGMGFGGGSIALARWVTVTHNVARHHDFAEGGGVTGAGDVEMRDSLIAHNVVTAPNYAAGGGVSRYGGALRLVNVEIRQNEVQAQSTATGGGGAFSGGQAHLTQTQVLSNVARSASSSAFNGGLNNLAALRVVTSTIAHNRAVGNSSSGSGGLGNTGSAEVIDSLIANNRVALPNGNPTGSGGGIVNGDSGTLTVRRSSILANSASAAAAINTYNTPNTHILNSTISGNDSGGGLSVVLTNTAYLTHTTIASNTGGGLGYPGVNVNAYGVLIAYNSYDCATWDGGVLNAVASLSGKTKNEHFQQMLRKARERGFRPEYVLMDSWYASLKNLKLIASFGWFFLTRLKSNRLVNPDRQGNRPIREVEIPPEGRVVHLKGFGLVRVFRTVSQNGDAEYWATNDLKMTEEKREELEKKGWGIEVYHRGLKQCCGVEQAQVRKAVSILGHLLLALRAFLRLEVYRLQTGVSWYEAKVAILREAIRRYLAHPRYVLQPTA